jgi:hypothetical protein
MIDVRELDLTASASWERGRALAEKATAFRVADDKIHLGPLSCALDAHPRDMLQGLVEGLRYRTAMMERELRKYLTDDSEEAKGMSISKNVTATARVTLTVEVIGGTWGSDASFEEVYRLASREAVDQIQGLLGSQARVVGEPQVTAVVVERKP